MSDPQWFYSSLAQVSAGLVGLLGGFLLVRLSSYIAEWRTARTTLLRLQRDFHAAERAALLLRVQGSPQERREVSERESAAWYALMTAHSDRAAASFPSELVVTLVVLAGLLAAGVLAPLVALGAPGTTEQVTYVAIIALLVAGVGLVMTRAAHAAFTAWRDLDLGEKTTGRITAWLLEHAD